MALPLILPRVGDRYTIHHPVEGGGMGTVYLASDQQSGERVAVKVMRDDLRPDAAARFEREVRTLNGLQHPAIVRYVDFGRTDAGLPFLVMEWLPGRPLDARLASHEPLKLRDALTVAHRVTSALVAVHSAGLIHRDIKPSNVFLVGDTPGRAKLIDFGLVRGQEMELMTGSGMALGTPGYMAPEQILGESPVDARADLYALGAVLFEMLTGKKPFGTRDAAALVTRPLFESAPRTSSRVAGVPTEIDTLVAQLLAREPDERPAGAEQVQTVLADALLSALEEGPKSATSASLYAGERRHMAVVFFRLPAPSSKTRIAIEQQRSTRPGLTDAPTSFGDDLATSLRIAELERLTELTARYGGQLRRLDSDTVSATVKPTGTPIDQAVRALRMALTLRTGAEVSPLAIATCREDVTLAEPRGPGDEAPDFAGSLLDAADGQDTIRLDEMTGLLLAGRMPVSQDARGHWLDPAKVREPDPGDVSEHLLPCMGRDRELSALEALWHECVEDERARVALVTAPAGVGKTRVARELLKHLGTRTPRPTVWFAPTDELGAGLPFGLIRRLLARAAGLSEVAPEAAQERWLSWLEARLPQLRGAALAQALADLSDLSMAPGAAPADPLQAGQAAARVENMQRAMAAILTTTAQANPLLVVLEDLHWADAASIRVIDAALRQAANVPWMVLALARPEVHEPWPRLWQHASPLHLPLPVLSTKASLRLVRTALGDRVDEPTAAHLVSHAGGNAFFLEELIRAVREGRGAVIPPTVLATVESRLLCLDPEARRLLRAASVIGQSFGRDALVAVLGGDERDIDERAWLDELVRRELLHGEEQPDHYRFAHALVHDAAYAMLTATDRTRAHHLAGDYLRATGCRDPLRVARHYGLAAQPVDAARCLVLAARQALTVGDKESARRHAEQAVADGGDADFVGEAHFIAAEACRQLGVSEAARAHSLAAVSKLPAGTPMWYAAQRTVVMVGMSSFYGRR